MAGNTNIMGYMITMSQDDLNLDMNNHLKIYYKIFMMKHFYIVDVDL